MNEATAVNCVFYTFFLVLSLRQNVFALPKAYSRKILAKKKKIGEKNHVIPRDFTASLESRNFEVFASILAPFSPSWRSTVVDIELFTSIHNFV